MIAGIPRSPGKPRLLASLNVRLSVDQLAELEAAAGATGVDVSVVAREAMRHGLQAAQRAIEESIEDAGGSPDS